MTESDTEQRQATGGSGDRRGTDRRRLERRAPLPKWRRPWALVGYGAGAALVLMLLLRGVGSEADTGERMEVSRTKAPPPVTSARPAAASAATIDAYGMGDFERMVAEGEAAVGQRVRTVLFCDPTRSISLMNVPEVSRSIAELADAERRVPGAECKWGADTSAPDFLLLVPPEMATRFASMPRVRQGFVDRRRVTAEVEWLGRPAALAVRTSGVLRQLR